MQFNASYICNAILKKDKQDENNKTYKSKQCIRAESESV